MAGTPVLEWIGAAVGAIVALGMIGGLVWEAVTHSEAPPRLSVTALAGFARPADGGPPERVVPFRVVNDGGRIAAQVTVVARTASAAGDVTETRVVFDFVPRGSGRRGAAVLPPGDAPVSFAVTGYREP